MNFDRRAMLDARARIGSSGALTHVGAVDLVTDLASVMQQVATILGSDPDTAAAHRAYSAWYPIASRLSDPTEVLWAARNAAVVTKLGYGTVRRLDELMVVRGGTPPYIPPPFRTDGIVLWSPRRYGHWLADGMLAPDNADRKAGGPMVDAALRDVAARLVSDPVTMNAAPIWNGNGAQLAEDAIPVLLPIGQRAIQLLRASPQAGALVRTMAQVQNTNRYLVEDPDARVWRDPVRPAEPPKPEPDYTLAILAGIVALGAVGYVAHEHLGVGKPARKPKAEKSA